MDKRVNPISSFRSLPGLALTILVSLLSFIQFSGATATVEHRNIGAYVITPDGNIGKIGTHIRQGNVVVGFHDKVNRTTRSKAYNEEEIAFSIAEHAGPNGSLLKPGDFVSVQRPEESSSNLSHFELWQGFFAGTLGDDQIIYFQVEALFKDKVLLKGLTDIYNNQYTPRAHHIYQYNQILERVDGPNPLMRLADEIESLSHEDFDRMILNLEKAKKCLDENICGFTIKNREFRERDKGKWTPFGKMTHTRYMDDVEISDHESFLKMLQRQATQFKLYTGLAHANKIQDLQQAAIRPAGTALQPLPGLDTIPFRLNGNYPPLIQEIVEADIGSTRQYMGSIFALGGRAEKHPENIFGKSEICNDYGCFQNSHYHDFIQPLYRIFIKELAQSQPFLVYLNWNLGRRDFSRAMGKAIKETKRAKKMIARLRGQDRLFLLSFTTTLERVVKKYPKHKKNLIRALIQVEADNQNFWKDLLAEVKKPQFLGVMGCYGVTIFTPIKFMNLVCHAAGLSVAGQSLITNIQKVKTYKNMGKMQLIPTDIYSEALFGLMVESFLSALYVRAVVPDFSRAFAKSASSLSSASMVTQSALTAQRGLIRNRGIKEVLDHIKQTLQKMGAGLLFTGSTQSAALAEQFLTAATVEELTYQRGADLFQEDLVTVGYVFTLIMSQPGLQSFLNGGPIPKIEEELMTDEMADLLKRMKEGRAQMLELRQELFAAVVEINTRAMLELAP